jgi:hypothetical protein
MVKLFDPNQEALEELMKQAEKYVTMQMYGEGKCPTRLYIHGMEGMGVFTPLDLSNEAAKNEFAAVARHVCLAHGANATVFVSEAWTVAVKKGRLSSLLEPPAPSQSPDREEVVIIMGEMREGHIQKILPIERQTNGHFKGFGEAHIEAGKIEGRFAGLVPAQIPTEEEREMAKVALEIMGVRKQRVQRKGKQRGRGLEM